MLQEQIICYKEYHTNFNTTRIQNNEPLKVSEIFFWNIETTLILKLAMTIQT